MLKANFAAAVDNGEFRLGFSARWEGDRRIAFIVRRDLGSSLLGVQKSWPAVMRLTDAELAWPEAQLQNREQPFTYRILSTNGPSTLGACLVGVPGVQSTQSIDVGEEGPRSADR